MGTCILSFYRTHDDCKRNIWLETYDSQNEGICRTLPQSWVHIDVMGCSNVPLRLHEEL